MRAGWLVATFLWPSLALGASPLKNLGAVPGSGLTIKAQSLFDHLPASGYVPITIDVENGTDADGTWILSSESSRSYNDAMLRYEERLSVRRGETRRFELYLPLPGIGADDHGQLTAEISLRGPSVLPGVEYLSGHLPGAMPSVPTIAIASGLYDAFRELEAVGQVETSTTDAAGRGPQSPIFRLLRFDPESLPRDWRGYLGLDAFWIGPLDLERLGADERTALKSWVAQGGELVLVQNEELLQPTLFERATWIAGNHGFGKLTTIRASDVAALEVTARQHRARAELERSPGGEGNVLSPVPVGRIPILLFLVAFVTLIGPINFLVFARPPHRGRLLYTTPIISVVAALLVLTLVLAGDGLGGEGRRVFVQLLVPDDHLAISVQSQIARTGLMLDAGLEAPPDRWVVEVGHLSGPNLHQTRIGDRLGGPWFPSRAHRAQLLESIMPTRAKVELVGAAPPKLRSTFGARLSNVHYLDANGRAWKVDVLDPGEEKTLVETSTRGELLQGLRSAFDLQRTLVADPRPGWFYGTPANPEMLEGGARIRWTDTALVMGPISAGSVR